MKIDQLFDEYIINKLTQLRNLYLVQSPLEKNTFNLVISSAS